MTFSLLFHPLATFTAGVLVALVAAFLLLSSCAAPNHSAADMETYRNAMSKVPPSGLVPGSAAEKAAVGRFTTFLTGIGDKNKVRDLTRATYAQDAYVDDTLTIHTGEPAIEEYFVKTNEAMTKYQVTIDDTARSGEDFYIRWTMVFAAKVLAGGEPVHSTGISQIRFNREGKVQLHRDFWDSGQNFYAHVPVAGGAIGFIRKRLQAN